MKRSTTSRSISCFLPHPESLVASPSIIGFSGVLQATENVRSGVSCAMEPHVSASAARRICGFQACGSFHLHLVPASHFSSEPFHTTQRADQTSDWVSSATVPGDPRCHNPPLLLAQLFFLSDCNSRCSHSFVPSHLSHPCRHTIVLYQVGLIPLTVTKMSGSTSVFNQPKPVVKLDQGLLDAINAGIQPYPLPEGRKYGYGTAGVGQPSSNTLNALLTLSAVSHESVSHMSQPQRST